MWNAGIFYWIEFIYIFLFEVELNTEEITTRC